MTLPPVPVAPATPVAEDDIVSGCVQWLSGFTDVVDILGAYATGGEPFLFANYLYTIMEGTQSTAAVVSAQTTWAGANLNNTLHFPRLSLEIYADPLRDSMFNVNDIGGEVYRRVRKTYEVLDRHLHMVAGGGIWWGTKRIVSSIRLGGEAAFPEPQGDGLLRMQTFYAITQG